MAIYELKIITRDVRTVPAKFRTAMQLPFAENPETEFTIQIEDRERAFRAYERACRVRKPGETVRLREVGNAWQEG